MFGFVSRVLTLISFLVCSYILAQIVIRYKKIKDLDKSEIREKEKSDYLEILIKYLKIVGVCVVADFIAFGLPFLEFRLIAAIASIMFAGNIYSDLNDEIADFDTTKKDSDILKDFLNEVKEDAKNKAGKNKIKKVDSQTVEEPSEIAPIENEEDKKEEE